MDHHGWAQEVEVRFGGHEGALTVFLGTGPTGVLVSREMRIECGPLDGLIKGTFDFDADAVRAALHDLLKRPDLSGEVRIAEAEHGEFRAWINLDHGTGVLSTRFESEFGLQDGGGVLTLTTDQSYLRETLRVLDGLRRT